MKTETIRLYEGREDVTLTTYVLEDSPELLDGKKRPAVLICPGGGYISCTDREAEPVALKFASMGYHAFVLRYSTYGEGKAGLPDLFGKIPVKENCQHPMPMLEIGKAMLMIRSHGEDWLVDTDRIAVCGFSAGRTTRVCTRRTGRRTHSVSTFMRTGRNSARRRPFLDIC